MAEKHWIKDAVPEKNAGKLHRALGIPEGEKIPVFRLEAAAKKGGTLAKEANFAKTMRKTNK